MWTPEGESPLNPEAWLEELPEGAERSVSAGCGMACPRRYRGDLCMRGLLFHSPCPSNIPAVWVLVELGSQHRVITLCSVSVSDALILLKQSSVLGIYSIAWDIVCQTYNAERQARCCLASGEQGEGLNAHFSIDVCPARKINDVLSDPLNYLESASLFDQVCGEKFWRNCLLWYG